MKRTVIVSFAHDVVHKLRKIDQEQVQWMKDWFNGEGPDILEFTYKNKTYQLNRDYVASIVVIQPNRIMQFLLGTR